MCILYIKTNSHVKPYLKLYAGGNQKGNHGLAKCK